MLGNDLVSSSGVSLEGRGQSTEDTCLVEVH